MLRRLKSSMRPPQAQSSSFLDKHPRLVKYSFIIGFLLPLIVLASFSYNRLEEELTSAAYERRENLAALSARVMEERFNRLSDIGNSFATRVQFRNLIAQGKWDEAIKILQAVPQDFPDIERVFLTDPKGVLQSDLPALPGVHGQNFSERDWYQGVTASDRSYVSNVYQRSAEPRYNVIAIATPIRAPGSDRMTGIVVLQVRLETLFRWASETEVGSHGFVYFVDRAGRVAAHPHYAAQGEIVDFSSVDIVQKALRGEKGVQEIENPVEHEERVSAYHPVEGYGWAVVAAEPAADVFKNRDEVLQRIATVDIIIELATITLAYVVFRMFRKLRASKAKITEQADRSKALLESIGDGVCAIDRNWVITLWNKAAEDISGWKAEEAIGQPFRKVMKLLQENNMQENVTFLEEVMVKGERRWMQNHTILITKKGEQLPVADSAAPVFDSSGQVIGAIVVFRDNTEALEAQQLHSDFAYASHQLRTPVTKALWRIESILEEKDSTKIEKGLQDIQQSIKSIRELATELVEVSEIDQSMLRPKASSVSMDQAIADIVKSLSPEADARGVTIHAESHETGVILQTDPEFLKRILSEVLRNGIYYSAKGGQIDVITSRQDSEILVEIRDTGIGISEEQQALVFTKFFRGANVDANEIEGAGLGLYIAKSYAKLLGGSMWLKNEKNTTSFFISLPIEFKPVKHSD